MGLLQKDKFRDVGACFLLSPGWTTVLIGSTAVMMSCAKLLRAPWLVGCEALRFLGGHWPQVRTLKGTEMKQGQ